jgi:predicted XRE-type DNA-binding protein
VVKKTKGKGHASPTAMTTGSVFDDLGLPPREALEVKIKADLHRALLGHIKAMKYTQKQLAVILNEDQPRISELMNGKIGHTSIKKLLRYLSCFGGSAEILARLPKRRAA